jgi:hypothetical protein
MKHLFTHQVIDMADVEHLAEVAHEARLEACYSLGCVISSEEALPFKALEEYKKEVYRQMAEAVRTCCCNNCMR